MVAADIGLIVVEMKMGLFRIDLSPCAAAYEDQLDGVASDCCSLQILEQLVDVECDLHLQAFELWYFHYQDTAVVDCYLQVSVVASARWMRIKQVETVDSCNLNLKVEKKLVEAVLKEVGQKSLRTIPPLVSCCLHHYCLCGDDGDVSQDDFCGERLWERHLENALTDLC